MKSSKQVRREAKALFRASVVNGVLDEGRVRTAVQQLVAVKPRGYPQILAQLQRLVQLDIDRRTATVDSAILLSDDLKNKIQQTLTAQYGPGLQFVFKQNPALLGGVRIRVGSDVYDDTVQGRLTQLQEALSQ